MIAFLLSTILTSFFITTIGIYFTKFTIVSITYVEKILLGLVVSNTLTTYLSLFFPINFIILCFFFFACLLLLNFIRKEFKILATLLYVNKYPIFCSLPFIIIAFFVSLSEPSIFDTGLYHLQSIKWIESFSAVPGLANLHGRFGFNPNIFTFFSLTSLHFIFKQEIFSVNFTVFAVLIFYFVRKLLHLFNHQGFSALFAFYIIIFFVILRLTSVLTTPSPDFLSITIPLFIFVRIIDMSSKKINYEFKSYIPILILSIYILTVKLAAIPILILSIFIILRHKSEFKKTLWLLPLLFLILFPWLARNVILTGWLVYPFPSLDLFSFEWKVPLADVIREKNSITGWARNPGLNYAASANMGFADWFPIWWHTLNLTVKVVIVISLLFPLFTLFGQFLIKNKINLFINIIIITSFIGVLFWLFMAPDLRFGLSFIIIASLSPLLYIKFHWIPPFKTTIVFNAIMIILIGCFTLINTNVIKENFHDIIYSSRIIIPKKNEIPPNVNFEINNINGFIIYTPTEGDRCFDHIIPCTPSFNKSIVLRGNTLESGFMHKQKDN